MTETVRVAKLGAIRTLWSFKIFSNGVMVANPSPPDKNIVHYLYKCSIGAIAKQYVIAASAFRANSQACCILKEKFDSIQDSDIRSQSIPFSILADDVMVGVVFASTDSRECQILSGTETQCYSVEEFDNMVVAEILLCESRPDYQLGFYLEIGGDLTKISLHEVRFRNIDTNADESSFVFATCKSLAIDYIKNLFPSSVVESTKELSVGIQGWGRNVI